MAPYLTDTPFVSSPPHLTPSNLLPSSASGPSKRPGKRSAVHTPVLQSIDTSPASIEAFKRLQPDTMDPFHVPQMANTSQPMQLFQPRSFVLGRGEGEADIFGIRIPQPDAQIRRENLRFRARKQEPRRGESSRLSQGMDTENETDAEMGAGEREEQKVPVWVRQGDKKPLGEMRMDSSLGNVDDSLEDSGEMGEEDPFAVAVGKRGGERGKKRWSESSSDGERKISREYPPSPKKSPVKRLLFKTGGGVTGLDVDSTYGSGHVSQDEEEEESFLGSMANGFMQRRGKGKKVQSGEEADEMAEMQHFERIERPRARRSLMRRRRTTVHEDPITSPKVDTTSRITKPEAKRIGSGSSLSSVEESAVVNEVVGKSRPGLPRRTSLMELEDTPRKSEQKRVKVMEEQMWDACGRDMARWNRGDFSSGSVAGLAKGLEVACRW